MASSRTRIWLFILAVASIAICGLSMFVGAGSLFDEGLRSVYLELRGLRTLTAFAVGASLSLAGVLVQATFANPLASPSVLGVSSGASLGGQMALLIGHALAGVSIFAFLPAEMLLPFGALLGGFAALGVLLLVLRVQRDPVGVLLAGFLLSSLFLSIGSFVLTLAMDTWSLGRALVTFALGSVSGSGLRQVLVAWSFLVVGSIALVFWARPLQLMLTGDDEAAALGLDIQRSRRWILAWAAVLSAGATAVAGTVAFAGLIVPHVVRTFTGERTRPLLVGSFFLGGGFVVACDILTRAIPTKGELPLGVVSGLIGAPVFLWIFLRWRGGMR
jgi:iron complex transport system permease protein